MTSLLSSLLFALACNLDTVLLAVGYRLRGMRLSPTGALFIVNITTIITALSLELGRRVALLLPPALPQSLGGLVLVILGLWFLLDWMRAPGKKDSPAPSEKSSAAWVALAAALGVNNAGAGIAAGVSGIDPLLGGAVNFAVTFLSLALGRFLGHRMAASSGWLGRCALPASGVLLVVLGMSKLLT
jgi:putative Mn2+ efflux pump MntP